MKRALVCNSIAIFTLMLCAASAQVQTNAEARAMSIKLYADAHPYMDEPLPELKKMLRELGGLQPTSSQNELSGLLSKVGGSEDALLRKIPNLISDEVVNTSQWQGSEGGLDGCVGVCSGPESRAFRDETFNYLIVIHPAENGQRALAEYRTYRNGKPLTAEIAVPYFQGFVSAWVIFSSPNQVESHFRYLGEQQVNGKHTFVIGFAQIPEQVASPGKITTEHGPIPMLLQGIAWINESDFRIVRLHTDLLKPQPEIQKQSADIVFGSVKVKDTDLWLPLSVHLEMESKGQFLHEEHKYSRYRLYQAQSKIILSTQN